MVYENGFNIKSARKNFRFAVEDLLEEANLKEGDIVVLGFSSSEILGEKIGKASSLEVAKSLLPVFLELTDQNNLFPAFQCCEHLNRALVVSKKCWQQYNLNRVTVIPDPDAGGAMAAAAHDSLKEVVVVEKLTAEAGVDVGDTFIGMHLREVAVPVRSRVEKIGEAHVTLARTRPKLIGGNRAVYP